MALRRSRLTTAARLVSRICVSSRPISSHADHPHPPEEQATADAHDEQPAPLTTEQYLRSLSQSPGAPTLADLEKHRPSHLPPAPSPNYSRAYLDTLDHLSKSFTKRQLVAFEHLLGRHDIKSRSKKSVLESVMAHGLHFPSPSAVDRERKERTEIHSESITLPPSALFFLLGKDGADLLQLSSEHNVHVSLAPNPLSLSVSGLRSSITTFCTAINHRNDVIHIKRIPSSSFLQPPSLQLLRKVSRLSGAFLEPDGSNIRINATDKDIVQRSEHLLTYLTNKESQTRHSTKWVLQPPNASSPASPPLHTPKLALFPHYRKASFGQRFENATLFRLAQVARWMPVASLSRDSLLHAEVIDQNATSLTLREALEQYHQTHFIQGTSLLTASFGLQMFDLSDRTEKAKRKASIFESSDIFTFIKWLRTNEIDSHFAPTTPEVLMSTTVEDAFARRYLVYSPPSVSPRRQTLTITLPSRERCNVPPPVTFADEFSFDILVPTKIYDMRFVLRSEQTVLGDHFPPELMVYCEAFNKDTSVLPPAGLNFKGSAYHLSSFHEEQLGQVYTVSGNQKLHTLMGTKSDLLTEETEPYCSISTNAWRDITIWKSLLSECDKLDGSISGL